MIDLEHLRQNPGLYKTAVARKRIPLDIDQLLAADVELRGLRQQLDRLREERNKLSGLVAQAAAPPPGPAPSPGTNSQ